MPYMSAHMTIYSNHIVDIYIYIYIYIYRERERERDTQGIMYTVFNKESASWRTNNKRVPLCCSSAH